MKFRKIISVVFAMFLGFNNQCFALLTSEEYYSCFKNQELSKIIINKLVKKEEELLKNMIDDDTDFSKWLGFVKKISTKSFKNLIFARI